MGDPALEAAERALVATRGHGHSTVCELASAREALKPIRDLHRYEFIRMKNDSLERCSGCRDYWPCPTARLVYTSEELGEQR